MLPTDGYFQHYTIGPVEDFWISYFPVPMTLGFERRNIVAHVAAHASLSIWPVFVFLISQLQSTRYWNIMEESLTREYLGWKGVSIATAVGDAAVLTLV